MRYQYDNRQRSPRGTFIVMVSTLAFFLLLPACVFVFEIGRLNLAQRQLQVATDAAAMAGALFVQLNPEMEDDELHVETNNWALLHVQRNLVMSTPLTNSRVGSPSSDPVGPGALVMSTAINDETHQVRADSAFGLVPAFGQFLGLGSVRITATAKAGGGDGGPIDVVFVLDHSGSMRQNVLGVDIDSLEEADAPAGAPPVEVAEPEDPATQSKMRAAEQAMATLLTNLKEENDAHFGLVKFNDHVSVSVKLDQSNDRAPEVLSSLRSNARYSTHTGGAMTAATNMLNDTSLHRPQAKKVIVILTDGLPHEQASTQNHRIDSRAWAHAYETATTAAGSDIATFTLGLFTMDEIDNAHGLEFITQFDLLCGNPDNGGKAYFFNDIAGLNAAVDDIKIKGDSEISLMN